MIRFNVPRLFYFPSRARTHIGRTAIAGCTTECGIVLKRGDTYTRKQPESGLCSSCVKEIEQLPYRRGLQA